ncbi:MAG: hypothetical protein M1829_006926 [Trizodia sp. TS-e1964]|nr:MAG: hypothetical protein M1829_006926 [Trizodia sp. TS-e1964]
MNRNRPQGASFGVLKQGAQGEDQQPNDGPPTYDDVMDNVQPDAYRARDNDDDMLARQMGNLNYREPGAANDLDYEYITEDDRRPPHRPAREPRREVHHAHPPHHRHRRMSPPPHMYANEHWDTRAESTATVGETGHRHESIDEDDLITNQEFEQFSERDIIRYLEMRAERSGLSNREFIRRRKAKALRKFCPNELEYMYSCRPLYLAWGLRFEEDF